MTRTAPQAPQPQAPASSRPWWDQSAPVTPRPPADYQPVPQEQPTQAPSARVQDRCPECGSKDYAPIGKGVGPGGTFQAWRCFDCGYPVDNSTRGMGMISNAPVQGKARQIAERGGTTSNYQPTNTAAGRVS